MGVSKEFKIKEKIIWYLISPSEYVNGDTHDRAPKYILANIDHPKVLQVT